MIGSVRKTETNNIFRSNVEGLLLRGLIIDLPQGETQTECHCTLLGVGAEQGLRNGKNKST